MESRSKNARSRMAAASTRVLPCDVIHLNILPRLSFKSLARFKSVCKTWHALISEDSLFAAVQSRHPSPASSGFVYLGLSGLEFLSSPDTPVGVPDPHLPVINKSYLIRLVASTNGLLCFYVHFFNCSSLCVLNPATQEHDRIPQSDHCRYGVGLAFDPSTTPARYVLVYPTRYHLERSFDDVEYRFIIFSSCTRLWVTSSQRLIVIGNFRWHRQSPVFGGGALYWDCVEHMIWFDPYKDLAGWMLFPITLASGRGRHAIGWSEGRVTYTVVLRDAVEVFVLNDSIDSSSTAEWSRRYRVSLEQMVERNRNVFAEFCNAMRLRSSRMWERLSSRWVIEPLSSEGVDKVYLRVWDANSLVDGERVLQHDLRTGEVILISNNLRFEPRENRILPYHNSMARLPI